MSPSRRFLLSFFVPVLALLPFGAANVVVLDHAGELLDAREVAAAQAATGGLYGSAIHDNAYAYKLAVYDQRRPEVAVIGSSRVLQMSQAMFDVPFANLGRTVNTAGEAELVAADMLAFQAPRIVLFALDPWWLNPRWEDEPSFESHDRLGGALTPESLMAPTRWLLDGRMPWPLYRDLLTGGGPWLDDSVPLYGVQAIVRHRGFRPDGSFFRGDLLTGGRPSDDVGFADTLARLGADQAQFRFGDRIDPERVDQLRRAVARLQAAGVTVVTYVPPVAPTVYAAMQKAGDRFTYLEAARAALASLGTIHLDAFDATALGAGDCEFDDGFHNGEVVDLRLLLALAALPGSPLGDVLDRERLAALLAQREGHAQVFFDAGGGGDREVDFLGLGCAKS